MGLEKVIPANSTAPKDKGADLDSSGAQVEVNKSKMKRKWSKSNAEIQDKGDWDVGFKAKTPLVYTKS